MTDKPDSAALRLLNQLETLMRKEQDKNPQSSGLRIPNDDLLVIYKTFETIRQALQREAIPADERISEYEAYKVLQNMTKGFTDAKPWQLICRDLLLREIEGCEVSGDAGGLIELIENALFFPDNGLSGKALDALETIRTTLTDQQVEIERLKKERGEIKRYLITANTALKLANNILVSRGVDSEPTLEAVINANEQLLNKGGD